jgi:3-hydroxyacyl-[acyl-carrier-protein] dehydratase
MEDRKIDILGIWKRLPHRYPFLLVDRVVDYEEGKWIKVIKNVTVNEPFFQGHFPEVPIMPGVLQMEAMAQAGGILAMAGESQEDKLAFFMTINKAKFRKPVVPGDRLDLNIEVIKAKKGIFSVHGEARVEGELASQGDLMFSIVDREEAGIL